jgi:hypothetical protein
MYDDEEEVEEEGGDGNQSQKAAGHQEWSQTQVRRRRIVTRAGRPGVTGNGSLTRVGRRRRMRRIRGVVGVIKVLDLILRGNEWHTKLMLVPLIKVCGEGRG